MQKLGRVNKLLNAYMALGYKIFSVENNSPLLKISVRFFIHVTHLAQVLIRFAARSHINQYDAFVYFSKSFHAVCLRQLTAAIETLTKLLNNPTNRDYAVQICHHLLSMDKFGLHSIGLRKDALLAWKDSLKKSYQDAFAILKLFPAKSFLEKVKFTFIKKPNIAASAIFESPPQPTVTKSEIDKTGPIVAARPIEINHIASFLDTESLRTLSQTARGMRSLRFYHHSKENFLVINLLRTIFYKPQPLPPTQNSLDPLERSKSEKLTLHFIGLDQATIKNAHLDLPPELRDMIQIYDQTIPQNVRELANVQIVFPSNSAEAQLAQDRFLTNFNAPRQEAKQHLVLIFNESQLITESIILPPKHENVSISLLAENAYGFRSKYLNLSYGVIYTLLKDVANAKLTNRRPGYVAYINHIADDQTNYNYALKLKASMQQSLDFLTENLGSENTHWQRLCNSAAYSNHRQNIFPKLELLLKTLVALYKTCESKYKEDSIKHQIVCRFIQRKLDNISTPNPFIDDDVSTSDVKKYLAKLNKYLPFENNQNLEKLIAEDNYLIRSLKKSIPKRNKLLRDYQQARIEMAKTVLRTNGSISLSPHASDMLQVIPRKLWQRNKEYYREIEKTAARMRAFTQLLDTFDRLKIEINARGQVHHSNIILISTMNIANNYESILRKMYTVIIPDSNVINYAAQFLDVNYIKKHTACLQSLINVLQQPNNPLAHNEFNNFIRRCKPTQHNFLRYYLQHCAKIEKNLMSAANDIQKAFKAKNTSDKLKYVAYYLFSERLKWPRFIIKLVGVAAVISLAVITIVTASLAAPVLIALHLAFMALATLITVIEPYHQNNQPTQVNYKKTAYVKSAKVSAPKNKEKESLKKPIPSTAPVSGNGFFAPTRPIAPAPAIIVNSPTPRK